MSAEKKLSTEKLEWVVNKTGVSYKQTYLEVLYRKIGGRAYSRGLYICLHQTPQLQN